MIKHLHILIFSLIILSIGEVQAQGVYFKLVPNSVSMEIKRKGGDSLTLFYRCVYIDSTGTPFNGTIYTMYNTDKNSTPARSEEVFSTGTGELNNNDTIAIFAFIRVTADYFRNGQNNIIVIWPTGGRSNGKNSVICRDSMTYPQMIDVAGGLSGINNANNVSNIVNIYPNPANSYLNIELKDPTQRPKMVRVTDISGKEIMDINLNLNRIDVSQLKPGSYFLEMEFADNRKVNYSFIIGR
jgi:hypothetical protein